MKLEGYKTRGSEGQLIIQGDPPPDSDANNREKTRERGRLSLLDLFWATEVRYDCSQLYSGTLWVHESMDSFFFLV